MSTRKRLEWVKKTHSKVPFAWMLTAFLVDDAGLPFRDESIRGMAESAILNTPKGARSRLDRHIPWMAKQIRAPIDQAVAEARRHVGRSFSHADLIDETGMPLSYRLLEDLQAMQQVEWGPGMARVLALEPRLRDALLRTFALRVQDPRHTQYHVLRNNLGAILDWSEQTGTPLEGMTALQAKFASDRWHEELKRNAAAGSAPQGEIVQRWDDGFTMQRLEGKRQLTAEGEAMGHCVGGYADRVASGAIEIYSLRDSKGRPHVTVEIKPAYVAYKGAPNPPMVEQCRGKGNEYPKARYCEYVADFFDQMKIPLENWGEGIACFPPARLVDLWRLREATGSVYDHKLTLPDGQELVLAHADAPRFVPTEELTEESPQAQIIEAIEHLTALQEGWDERPGTIELGLGEGDVFAFFSLDGDDVTAQAVDAPHRFAWMLAELGHEDDVRAAMRRIGLSDPEPFWEALRGPQALWGEAGARVAAEWSRASFHKHRRFMVLLARQIVTGRHNGAVRKIWRYGIGPWSESWVVDLLAVVDEINGYRDAEGARATILTGGSQLHPSMMHDDYKRAIADGVAASAIWGKAVLA